MSQCMDPPRGKVVIVEILVAVSGGLTAQANSFLTILTGFKPSSGIFLW